MRTLLIWLLMSASAWAADPAAMPTFFAPSEAQAPEPYVPRYRQVWRVNGSLSPDYVRNHLLNSRNHAELSDQAIRNLTDAEVIRIHSSHHEGLLDVARFNAYFSARERPQARRIVGYRQVCVNGRCQLVPVYGD